MLIGFIVLATTPLLLIALYRYLRRRETAHASEAGPDLRARRSVLWLIGVLALASVAYHVLLGNGLGQTSALFIGIPALLSCATVFAPARSAIGVAFKAITIGLLLSLMTLQEGALCILMSAPLFYLVALLIGAAIPYLKARDNSRRLYSWIALLAIVPMSMEGTTPLTTVDRHESVSVTRIVRVPADQIAAAIHLQPRFDRALPVYLAMGFPRPASTRIDGQRWIIRMRGGEMKLNGMDPRAGDLILERAAEGAGFVSWRTVSDDSHMTHFLDWRSSRVAWEMVDANTTRVTWTLDYERRLDPAWYFGPMERYAMELAAGYLIDTVATP